MRPILEIAMIFHNITVLFCIFDRINTALLSSRDSRKKHKQFYWSQTYEQLCVYIYIINIYRTHTYIMQTKTFIV